MDDTRNDEKVKEKIIFSNKFRDLLVAAKSLENNHENSHNENAAKSGLPNRSSSMNEHKPELNGENSHFNNSCLNTTMDCGKNGSYPGHPPPMPYRYFPPPGRLEHHMECRKTNHYMGMYPSYPPHPYDHHFHCRRDPRLHYPMNYEYSQPNMVAHRPAYSDNVASAADKDLKKQPNRSFTIDSILSKTEEDRPDEKFYPPQPPRGCLPRLPYRAEYNPHMHAHHYNHNCHDFYNMNRKPDVSRSLPKRSIYDCNNFNMTNVGPPVIWNPEYAHMNDPSMLKAKYSSGENSDSPAVIYRPGKRGRPPKRYIT